MTEGAHLTTALHDVVAGGGGAQEVAEALRAGADVDAQDESGNTALFLAASSRNLEALTALLDAGADLEIENAWGNTPLWSATFNSRGDGRIIEALLERGADPDHRNAAGNSPRTLAARVANYDLQRFFPPH
ncbi:ankyrin repeat domain-containing protein [Leifsonia sp. TF02-11]|uniref:ankyrin repeat domain-containing protein n=1 Tax=Leifsonia sp. TF02-11 TaxID=2815212 RepID=UPI001AA17C44|nr:ankyrin repeat domain-containing protein [Leifsonia sp. TF02-11]MBO1739535.1 ankyrin repeat domain-containing protein [Leifsonia sp. TF02-11]